MTIQDIIEAGVELQGPCRVVSWDGEAESTWFEGRGGELGQEAHMGEPWLCEAPIAYIHPIEDEEGFVIEVAV